MLDPEVVGLAGAAERDGDRSGGPHRATEPTDGAPRSQAAGAPVDGPDPLTLLQIDHAQLRARGERREAWSDASIQTAATFLQGVEERPLPAVASRVRSIAAADAVTILRGRKGAAGLIVEAATGRENPLDEGDLVPVAGTTAGAVFEGGQPQLLAGELPPPAAGRQVRGPVMAAPMRGAERTVGVIVVERSAGGRDFDAADLELLATFIDHATVAVELTEARADREHAALLEERARIARDLHDTAIQQLFAAGLELRATATAIASDEAVAGVLRAVGLVDTAITQIRTAVLALSPDPTGDSLRHRILEVVHELGLAFGTPPLLEFDGPVDLIARGDLTEDLVAVVRESLANVAKHASAVHAGVVVRAGAGTVEVEVWDDGVGMPGHHRRSGMANLADRAAGRGGGFTVVHGSPGTRVFWRIPVDAEGEGT